MTSRLNALLSHRPQGPTVQVTGSSDPVPVGPHLPLQELQCPRQNAKQKHIVMKTKNPKREVQNTWSTDLKLGQ